jgi:hypothetical protein
LLQEECELMQRCYTKNVPVLKWHTPTAAEDDDERGRPHQPATSCWTLPCCPSNSVVHIHKGSSRIKVSEALQINDSSTLLSLSCCIFWKWSHCLWWRLTTTITLTYITLTRDFASMFYTEKKLK